MKTIYSRKIVKKKNRREDIRKRDNSDIGGRLATVRVKVSIRERHIQNEMPVKNSGIQ